MKEFINKNSTFLRQVTCMAGNIVLIIAGLIFVLFVDLKISWIQNSTVAISVWLFLDIITVIGAAVCYFIGDSMKNKKKATLIVKGIGLVLGICYYPVLVLFKTKALAQATNASSFNPIMTILIVLSVIGLIILAMNYALSVIFINEDY